MQETIAVVFDFDDTLGTDTTSGYLQKAGLTDISKFWREEVGTLTSQDWDPVPAYLYKIIEASRSGRIPPVTRQSLVDYGQEVGLHEGVRTIFDRLRRAVKEANPRISLEFYIISSGIGDIIRHTQIAREFNDIWASEFFYDDSGQVVFPKKIVSFTDKTRYLFQIQKGIIGSQSRSKPFEVNRKLRPEQIRIPLNQMVFVGDGYTDIPCFALVKKEGGVSIAVYDSNQIEKWGSAYQYVADGRVTNLHSANFSEKSDLSNFLIMAVRNIANRIAVAASTYQG